MKALTPGAVSRRDNAAMGPNSVSPSPQLRPDSCGLARSRCTRCEDEDQGRIWIRVVKSGRAPGLDHQPLRDDLERRTGKRAIEGLERRTRLEADRDRRTSDGRMLRGIGVHHEETFGRGRQDDRLGNDGSHGTRVSSSESGDIGQDLGLVVVHNAGDPDQRLTGGQQV